MATQVSRYGWTMNRAEREAVKRLWERDRAGREEYPTYRSVRKRFRYNTMMGCWTGELYGITIGIEPDGYAHS